MQDLFSLKSKKAVVVGGAGGMGTAIATGLAANGADLAIADISVPGLEKAAAAITEKTGAAVKTYTVDGKDEASVQALLANVIKDLGGVDILFNAQGINFKAPATEYPMDEWDKLFSVNVKSVMLCAKTFAAHFAEQGHGKIVSLSSVRGQRGALGGNSGYCATKGAVDMITKQLACELAAKNVQVNALGPIITVTPMTEQRIKDEWARYERMLQNVPMGRLATVEDLVGPAVFLASAASDFITGTILYVDGGMMSFA
jgi:NAD(P)-dependent dehydrogenase (short-subunit alcohol dehydrogenase family)